MKNILKVMLTGGSGFIGSNLIRAFRDENIRTLSVDINLPEFETPDEFIRADVRDFSLIERIIHSFRPECIIHLAAVATIQEAALSPVKTWQINTEGTRSVINANKNSGCDSKIIFASTDKVYGRIKFTEKYTEDMLIRPLEGSPYDQSKAEADRLVMCNGGTVLRLCNIYGPYDTHMTRIVPVNVKRILSGCPGILSKYRDESGVHNFFRDMLHVNDLCKAVISLLRRMNISPERFAGQAFNIGTSECCSMESVLDEICRSSGSSLNHEIRYADINHELPVQTMDISKAVSWFNYSPSVSISEGIKHTVQWWKGRNKEI